MYKRIIIILAVGLIIFIVSAIVSILKTLAKPIAVIATILVGVYLILKIYEYIYFSSEKFKNIKQSHPSDTMPTDIISFYKQVFKIKMIQITFDDDA